MRSPGLELKPTFLQRLFRFENLALVPDHYEAYPFVPNFVGQWAVYAWSGSEGTPQLAVDVLSADQAELLAVAARDKAIADADLYGYTEDIWILSPNGNHTRFYMGGMSK